MIQPNCTATWEQKTLSGTDAFGNDTYTTTTVSVDAVFAPGGSSELTQGGDLVTTQPTVYLPLPAPSVVDRMTVNDVTYEVDGTPQEWPASPFTSWRPEYPVVVRLKSVTG